jgi:hypothetical protein
MLSGDLHGALHERGFKIGTERKWASSSSGTVVKTAKGWVDKATGKPATPGGDKGGAGGSKSTGTVGGAVAKARAKGAEVAGQAKAAVAKAPHVAKGIMAKIRGLPEAAKRLVTDRDYRSKMGHKMVAAFKRKSTHAIKSIVGELREVKDAGTALKKLALRQKLDKHDKHALKGVAKMIGTTLAGTIAIGGLAHVTAVALGTHFAAETLLKHTARSALFAHMALRGWPIYESDDAAIQEVVERVLDQVMLKLESLGDMSDEDLASILSSAQEDGQETDQAESKDDDEDEDDDGDVKISGEKDWDPKAPQNKWVPDDVATESVCRREGEGHGVQKVWI